MTTLIQPRALFIAASLLGMAFLVVPAASASDASLPPPMQEPEEVINPAAVMRLQQLSATQERPLFSPARHVPVQAPIVTPVALPPPAVPAPPPSVALLGIILGLDKPSAIIRSDSSSKAVLIHAGENIGAWRVTQIDPQKFEMSLDDRSVDVKLFAGSHGGSSDIPTAHPQQRVLEVNAAGVLRSRPVHHQH